jgi:hypothetical protein
MFTGFGVRPQQAKIVFVYTKTLLATDLCSPKSLLRRAKSFPNVLILFWTILFQHRRACATTNKTPKKSQAETTGKE